MSDNDTNDIIDIGEKDDELDVDPLELKQLSLSFDYLMFKIKDHIATLTEQTYQSVKEKEKLIYNEYFQDQLKLEENYEQIDSMLTTCDQIKLEFSKLDQLEVFISDFKSRLQHLETEFAKR